MPQNEIISTAKAKNVLEDAATQPQPRSHTLETPSPGASPATAATSMPRRKRGRPRRIAEDSLVEEGQQQTGEKIQAGSQIGSGYRVQRADGNKQFRGFFAQRLKQLRLEYKYTQTQLGHLAGVSTSLISRFEISDVMPTLQTTQNIAAAFGMSVSQLIEPTALPQVVSIEGVDEEVVALLRQLNGRQLSPMTRRLVAAIVEQILADNEQAE